MNYCEQLRLSDASRLLKRRVLGMRELIATHKDLAAIIEKLEANQDQHGIGPRSSGRGD